MPPEPAGPPRHLLALADVGAPVLRALVDHAHARKAARTGRPRAAADDDRPLDGHILACLFQKPSTRTRLSFEIAMRQLGGAAMMLDGESLQLGRGETIEDTARVLSGFVDAAMLRVRSHADLEAFAAAASVPVLNGLTDLSHPCQALADVMTVEERLGRPVRGTRWAWLGDGNNVCHSIIEAAGLFGFDLALAVSADHRPNAGFVDRARRAGAAVQLHEEAGAAVAGADVVATDSWVSMGQPGGEAKIRAMEPFRVDEALMTRAAAHAVFLHCLPAHRGEEVTAGVIDGPASAVWIEAENRVHAQKALLLWALGARA